MSFSEIIYIKVYVTNFTVKVVWALDLKSEKNLEKRKERNISVTLLPVCSWWGGHLMKVSKDFQHCTSCRFCFESVLAETTDCGMSFNLYLEESTGKNSTNTCFEGRRVPTLLCHICSWKSAWRCNLFWTINKSI